MIKLSIIVPVYNTGKYLKKCLDSLVLQANQETEILVINDGSNDNSEEIVQKYKQQNPSIIKYYKKQNTGIADTRNIGIAKATGKYILFVDSDDYIKENLIQELEKYMSQDIDIIKFKLEKVNENGEILERIDGPIFDKVDGQTAFNILAFSDVLIDSPCVYLLKKELFEKNKLKFKLNTEHEDFGLIPLVILKAKDMVSINTYGYCYLQTTNSITRNENYEKTIKKVNDVFMHYDTMIKFIEKESLNSKTKKNIKTYYTNAIILKLKELKRQDLDTYIKEIRKRKMIKNIQVHSIKLLIKKIILLLNIRWYLKLK